jgi:cyclopropane-fatty-acyl-phospholipid synthase
MPDAPTTTRMRVPASDRRRALVEDVLSTVDVAIDGDRPWDIKIRDERFFRRVLSDGALGLGESYMDGWWDAESLDDLFARLATLDPRSIPIPWSMRWVYLKERLINRQSRSRANRIAVHHYDLGNDLFQAMLDPSMAYTCAYWKSAHTLAEAQVAKFDLVCRKLDLKPGQSILDIGCGWGSFIRFAAERYGVHAVGVNNSVEQTRLGREMCAGLSVEFRLQDYREITGTFDHVVSIGMFEAVGRKNFRTFFEVADRCLRPEGLFLLHTIGSNTTARAVDAWMERYIFPDGAQPAIADIGAAAEQLFVVEDWHTFGADYDPTLMAWFANFDAAWPRLRERYGDRFYRMWKYFLLSCAGSFRARRSNLWQIVLSKRGVPGGYRSVR